MKKNKLFHLLLLMVFAAALFSFAGCGSEDTTKEDATIEQNDTAANSTKDTKDPAKDSVNPSDDTNIKITVTSPTEDAEVSGGTLTLSGSVEGAAKEIKATMMLNDETVIGEGKALIADVSHEFTSNITYTVPEDKKDTKGTDCKIKLACYDANNKVIKEETVHVNLK